MEIRIFPSYFFCSWLEADLSATLPLSFLGEEGGRGEIYCPDYTKEEVETLPQVVEEEEDSASNLCVRSRGWESPNFFPFWTMQKLTHVPMRKKKTKN